MSKFYKFFGISAALILYTLFSNAQTSSYQKATPGMWQTFGNPVDRSQFSFVNGRLCNFLWKDIEPSNNVWDFTTFDKDLTDRTKDGLPVIFMVYTKEDAPDWIYSAGVPKVTETDNNGKIVGYSPYFADTDYKYFFKRMIQKVHSHIESLPTTVRNGIVGVQGCYGSTGDYISYKGNVPSQYDLDSKQFLDLFKEFSQYYYNEYKNTSPKIYLMSNPRNQGNDAAIWVQDNCPGWQKTGTLGKGFQLNDEADKLTWLYDMINIPQNSGEYMRTRSEMTHGNVATGWWKRAPYKNMFAVMCYGISWGLDWSNQDYAQLNDNNYDSSFLFFSKYAGQKNPASSTNAMCALKDALDAADAKRFPASTYGTVSRTNQQRYINIANKYSSKGALLEDVKSATLAEMDNIRASGTNDVGWNLMPGNYDRFLHQLIPNKTSIGYWNIQSKDSNSMYGRFGRAFDVAHNKMGLYFDVDNAFFSNKPLKGQYTITIEVTYLDKGTGGWQLYYDAQTGPDKASGIISCTNTNKWKKATITIPDAYFGNKGPNASDFSIRSTSKKQDVIFSVVELSRPSNFAFSTKSAISMLSSNTNSQATSITNDTNVKDQLLINPNPATDHFYIQTKDSQLIRQVIIYNQSGQIILQKQVSAGLVVVVNRNEMAAATPGIYFIKVSTATALYTGKLMVL
ncbi:T9SS type A sorting domain-containing protein [Panacibacter ginsenosidivorans]|uniref:T9SS type A sorting domain-containing protein n=1 Tax=Panacibacter ginsenosidivorans TaxID=1813871 RepID=A0A5B8V8E3_9BACT|nr:T9SS type A sorting domain-containing protein [Panacibacter ginsenosidivorans]QEC67757.1 T9SS type A sorting domain-containing protein [Panacibacter ginsenosidivorans]